MVGTVTPERQVGAVPRTPQRRDAAAGRPRGHPGAAGVPGPGHGRRRRGRHRRRGPRRRRPAPQPFAHITASLPTVKEVLTSNDFRTGVFDPGDGVLGPASVAGPRSRVALGPLTPPSLLVTEPPDHTRYRKLVTRVFTARAVEGLRAPDPGDRRRAPRRARTPPTRSTWCRRTAAGCRSRSSPRSSACRRRTTTGSWSSAPPPRPASTSACRWSRVPPRREGARRVPDLAGRPPGAPARPPGRRPA